MERSATVTPGPGWDIGQENPEVGDAQGQPQPDNEEENVPRTNKPGFVERFMTKYDINVPTLMMMFK
jgi:hypothetical protein